MEMREQAWNHPSRRPYRLIIFLVVSFMIFGSYFAYNSVGAIEDYLMESMGVALAHISQPAADANQEGGSELSAPLSGEAAGETAGELLVRPYEDRDREAVIELRQACELVVPWNNPERDIERKLRVNPELFLVGEVDGEVAEFYRSIGYKTDDVLGMGKRLKEDEPCKEETS